MRRARRNLGRTLGFSLLELAVVVSIVGILAGMLLKRVQFYQEQAEKAAMEQTLGIMRSALHLRVASFVAKGQVTELPKLLHGNPMNWLAEKPKNYLGEYFAPKPQDIELGSWYFDLRNGNLIYSVRNNAHFRIANGEQNQVRFQVQLVTARKDFSSASDRVIEGVILSPIVPYQWF